MGERYEGREASEDGTAVVLKVGDAVGTETDTNVGCGVEGDAVGIGFVQRPQLKSQMGD